MIHYICEDGVLCGCEDEKLDYTDNTQNITCDKCLKEMDKPREMDVCPVCGCVAVMIRPVLINQAMKVIKSGIKSRWLVFRLASAFIIIMGSLVIEWIYEDHANRSRNDIEGDDANCS